MTTTMYPRVLALVALAALITATPAAATPLITACADPQHITVQTVRALSLTHQPMLVAIVTAVGPANTISAVRFGSLSNAAVTLNGQPVVSGQTLELRPSLARAFVVVERVGAGPVMVPFTVVNVCGEWPTFVGAGAGAF